jgi:hypothetical protein
MAEQKNNLIHYIRHAHSCSNTNESIDDHTEQKHEQASSFLNSTYSYLMSFVAAPVQTTKETAVKISEQLSPYRNKLFHPTLSYRGINQAICARDEINKQNYDLYVCSSSARTIMTALFSLRGSDKDIYIIPGITELESQVSKVARGGIDLQNISVKVDNLRIIIKFIKDWMEESWCNYFCDELLCKYVYDFIIAINGGKFLSSIFPQLSTYVPKNIAKKLIDDYIKSDESIEELDENDKKTLIQSIMNLFNHVINIKEHAYSNTKYVKGIKTTKLIDEIIIKYYNDYKQYKNHFDNLKKFTDRNFLRGPKINYSLIKEDDGKMKDFNQAIRDACIKLKINDKNQKILCYTHGSRLNKFFELGKSPLWTMIMKKEENDIYNPTNNIKHIEDKITNDENMSFCSMPGRFFNKDEKYGIFPRMDDFLVDGLPNRTVDRPQRGKLPIVVYKPSEDTEFFHTIYEKETDFEGLLDALKINNEDHMKKKYLKYKQKYYKLKTLNNY